MKVREVIRLIETDGWRQVRQTGSHKHYRHPSKPGLVTIPDHRNKDLGEKTYRSILKQAGLRKED
jgi:predicted RNA binding protein YcfA (HicA-like mRNA interferase family)